MIDDGDLELIAPDEQQHVLPSGTAPQDGVPRAVHDHLGEHLRTGHQVEQAAGDHAVLVRDHAAVALAGRGQRHVGAPLFAVGPGEHQRGGGEPDGLGRAPAERGRGRGRRLGHDGGHHARVVRVPGRVVPQSDGRVGEHVHAVRLVRPPETLEHGHRDGSGRGGRAVRRRPIVGPTAGRVQQPPTAPRRAGARPVRVQQRERRGRGQSSGEHVKVSVPPFGHAQDAGRPRAAGDLAVRVRPGHRVWHQRRVHRLQQQRHGHERDRHADEHNVHVVHCAAAVIIVIVTVTVRLASYITVPPTLVSLSL